MSAYLSPQRAGVNSLSFSACPSGREYIIITSGEITLAAEKSLAGIIRGATTLREIRDNARYYGARVVRIGGAS